MCYTLSVILNRTLGLDLVVRDPEANIIDPDSTGVIELYRRVRLTTSLLFFSVMLSLTWLSLIATI